MPPALFKQWFTKESRGFLPCQGKNIHGVDRILCRVVRARLARGGRAAERLLLARGLANAQCKRTGSQEAKPHGASHRRSWGRRWKCGVCKGACAHHCDGCEAAYPLIHLQHSCYLLCHSGLQPRGARGISLNTPACLVIFRRTHPADKQRHRAPARKACTRAFGKGIPLAGYCIEVCIEGFCHLSAMKLGALDGWIAAPHGIDARHLGAVHCPIGWVVEGRVEAFCYDEAVTFRFLGAILGGLLQHAARGTDSF